MNDISNSDDVLDVRDIIERVEELESEIPESVEESSDGDYAEARQELATLRALLDELKGYGGDHQWGGDWYPVTLVRDSYFVEYAEELCKDVGYLSKDLPDFIEIDWEATAQNIRIDYSSVEFDGVTYWYR